MDSLPLCLDFANTLSWRTAGQPVEKLTNYGALVRWARLAGILPAREARRMIERARRSPARAAAAFRHAITLRESIYRICAAVAAGHRATAPDLGILNEAVRQSLERLEIASQARGFIWRWPADADSLDRVLWPVARSAAELLTSNKLEKIRVCAGRGCGWLFLDLSRNHSRRWCDMRECGNREKARRHYQRQRQAKGDASA